MLDLDTQRTVAQEHPEAVMTDHLTILDVVAGPDGQERIVGIEVMGDADVVDPAGCWGWLRHKRTFAARFS